MAESYGKGDGDGDCYADMKCPHCGEMMHMMASKGADKVPEQGPNDMDGKAFDEDDFRKAMSPRSNDTPY